MCSLYGMTLSYPCLVEPPASPQFKESTTTVFSDLIEHEITRH